MVLIVLSTKQPWQPQKGLFLILFVKIITQLISKLVSHKTSTPNQSSSCFLKRSNKLFAEKLAWEKQNSISEGSYQIVLFLTRIHDLKASVTAKVVVCML
jgi:hypothetical protein